MYSPVVNWLSFRNQAHDHRTGNGVEYWLKSGLVARPSQGVAVTTILRLNRGRLASAASTRFTFQPTIGFSLYGKAVRYTFGWTFAQVIKSFGSTQDEKNPARRYSPPECTGVIKQRMLAPGSEPASTSYVERNSLYKRAENDASD